MNRELLDLNYNLTKIVEFADVCAVDFRICAELEVSRRDVKILLEYAGRYAVGDDSRIENLNSVHSLLSCVLRLAAQAKNASLN